jgi:hypothetical protein
MMDEKEIEEGADVFFPCFVTKRILKGKITKIFGAFVFVEGTHIAHDAETTKELKEPVVRMIDKEFVQFV